MFIALEGIDGSGKTTTLREVARFLRESGRDVYLTAEPTRFESGRLIREFLKADESSSPLLHEKLALLFAADRLHHLEHEIQPMLAAGKTVLTDRYLFSSIAYQSLHLPYQWVKEINKFAKLPDMVLFIDVSVDTALSRITSRDMATEVFEKKELLSAVRENYEQAIADYSPQVNVIRLNGELAMHQIYQDVQGRLSLSI